MIIIYIGYFRLEKKENLSKSYVYTDCLLL